MKLIKPVTLKPIEIDELLNNNKRIVAQVSIREVDGLQAAFPERTTSDVDS